MAGAGGSRTGEKEMVEDSGRGGTGAEIEGNSVHSSLPSTPKAEQYWPFNAACQLDNCLTTTNLKPVQQVVGFLNTPVTLPVQGQGQKIVYLSGDLSSTLESMHLLMGNGNGGVTAQ